MRLLIVEDEELAVKKLTRMLNALDPSLIIEGVTDSIQSSVEWLLANPSPDLILMDIELADGQSFEILKRVKISCPVIFTTSYDEPVVKTFHLSESEYLLKPIQKDELSTLLMKYRQ
jgi:two-component system, LytTR family, response regulator LytT